MKGFKKLLTIAMVFAMLSALLVPATVFAATTTGTTTGNVTVLNSAPALGTPTMDALTPGTASSITLTVPVTDSNSLNDITEIDVVIAFDTDGVSGVDGALDGSNTPAVCTLGIFKWVPTAGGTFSCEGPASTNWAVVTTGEGAKCVTPTLTGSSGNFVFEFTTSEVASYAVGGDGEGIDGWDVYIKVTDGTVTVEDGPKATQGAVPLSLVDKAMAAYASVSASPGTISFGSLSVGASGQPLTTPAGYYTTTSVVNKGYALQIHSVDWTDGGSNTLTLDVDGGTLAANSFSLKVDDVNVVPDPAVYVTKSAATIAGHETKSASTTEAGSGVPVYLWVSLADTIVDAAYSGLVTMTVVY